MGFIQGEAREQVAMFPSTLDEFIPEDHICRVIEAFVDGLNMAELGFVRAEAAETGRPGYDPRDLLKLYLYGYLQQLRSSRRLESECTRNVEVMWLLGRLRPDHKSIAEFRRMHLEAVAETGAELVRFARSVGLVKGEWVAIDGSKFRAVTSTRRAGEREVMKRYLEQMEAADQEGEVMIDHAATKAALEKLRHDPEPEALFMHCREGNVPAYNIQTAVDAQHALIVVQQVTCETNDERSLLPMAQAAQKAVGKEGETLNVVADEGYSNGEQAAGCEAQGIVPHVPPHRSVNHRGDGTLFDRSEFNYQPETDTYLCPAGKTLKLKNKCGDRPAVRYIAAAKDCGACLLKARCTTGRQRMVSRHLHEEVLDRMRQRTTAAVMKLRRCVVEHPFAILKYRIFGHPRFLLRGLRGARTEIGLATIAYNLKRMTNVLGGRKLSALLAG